MNTNILSIEASQTMNNWYAEQTGAISKRNVILLIVALSVVFAFISVAGSAYGLYYDMFLDYGHEFSLALGIIGGVAIETIKIIGVIGFFAWASYQEKTIFGVLLIGATVIAIALHYKGADNMERTKSVLVVQEVQKRNMLMQDRENARKDKIVNIANDIVRNGTIADDIIAMKTLSNIDSYSNSLYSRGKISDLDMMQINEVKRSSKNRAEALKIILPLFEILSIFGFLGAYLKTRSVSVGVKAIVKKRNEHNEVDAALALLENEKSSQEILTGQILQAMDSNFKAKHKIDAAQDPQETLAQKLQRLYGVTEEELKAKVRTHTDTQQDELVLLEDRFAEYKEDKAEEVYDEANEPIYTTIENQKVRALDYKLFNKEEREALLIMYDNGHILPAEHLTKRTAIVAELRGSIKNIGEVLTNLYGKLLENGHIESSPRGYKAKSALSKELWQEKES